MSKPMNGLLNRTLSCAEAENLAQRVSAKMARERAEERAVRETRIDLEGMIREIAEIKAKGATA